VIAVNFSTHQFRAETVAAWLAFYVEAQKSPPMRRLLIVYARRLHSNLMSGLSAFLPRIEAIDTAETIAAMIDGFYIRRALKDGPADAVSAERLVEDYVELRLAR
jgi:TetR/AcrR family transcriptional repressor of bet genes